MTPSRAVSCHAVAGQRDHIKHIGSDRNKDGENIEAVAWLPSHRRALAGDRLQDCGLLVGCHGGELGALLLGGKRVPNGEGLLGDGELRLAGDEGLGCTSVLGAHPFQGLSLLWRLSSPLESRMKQQ